MSGVWIVRKRGDNTERVGWYGLRADAERQAAELNVEYGTDAFRVATT